MEEEQPQQQPAQQPEKTKKKPYKKWWFWVLAVLSFIVIGWYVFSFTVQFVFRNHPEGIELKYFGFCVDYVQGSKDCKQTTTVLGGSVCSLFEGDSEAEIIELTYDVIYGSIEVNGEKVANNFLSKTVYAQVTILDGCGKVFDHSPAAKNGFGTSFKYIAPDEMPTDQQDVITVFMKNKKGQTRTEELIINLITVEEFINRNIAKKCYEGKNEAVWTTGAESSPTYQKIQNGFVNLENALNCTIDDSQEICSSNEKEYKVFHLGLFTGFLVVDDFEKDGQMVRSAYSYTYDGKQERDYCTETPQPGLCTLDRILNWSNSIQEDLDYTYFNERNKVYIGLSGVDSFNNRLYDRYVNLGELSPNDPIENINNIDIDLFIDVTSSTFYQKTESSDGSYEIIQYPYSSSTQHLYKGNTLCETLSNSDKDAEGNVCEVPKYTIEVIDYLVQLNQLCVD